MIIKSMARKQPSFGQLIAYMDRDADRNFGLTFARNLYCELADKTAVAAEFTRNHAHLPKRKRGNALYHELIVLERTDSAGRKELTRILGDLAERYLEARAPDHLAYARVHHDTENAHIHIMISANAIRSDRRRRLTRARFAEIQREVEAHARARYPELGITRIYDRDRSNDRLKTRAREDAVERRTKQPSKKARVREAVETAFEKARSGDDLYRMLADKDLTLYRRSKAIGVIDRSSGKRYRLKTLGLEAAFESICSLFERQAERAEALTHSQRKFDPAREIRSAAEPEPKRQAPPEADARAASLSAAAKPWSVRPRNICAISRMNDERVAKRSPSPRPRPVFRNGNRSQSRGPMSVSARYVVSTQAPWHVEPPMDPGSAPPALRAIGWFGMTPEISVERRLERNRER